LHCYICFIKMFSYFEGFTGTKGAVKPRSSLDVVRADDIRSDCCAISTDDDIYFKVC